MKLLISTYIPAALFVAASVLLYFWRAPVEHLGTYIDGHTIASYVAFVALLTIATVLMPITVMPIIPVAAPIFGPFVTGVLSVIGWTLGAIIAFLIARYIGRPVVGRFVPLRRIDEYSKRLPKSTQFLGVVLLRLTLPVDIMSYVIGIASSIGFVTYSLGTLVGVIWFSFAFAYLGEALFARNATLLVVVGGASLVVFLSGWYMLLRQAKRDRM